MKFYASQEHRQALLSHCNGNPSAGRLARLARPCAIEQSEGAARAVEPSYKLDGRVDELFRAGKYADAIPLAQQALALREKALGPNHLDVAKELSRLAAIYNGLERYAEMEPLYKRALAIRERALGRDHFEVGEALNNLAYVYGNLGRLAEAEPLYERSLAIRERTLRPDHPYVGVSAKNLAMIYAGQGRDADALALTEKYLGPDHPDVALFANHLAARAKEQHRYAEAEALYKRTLAIQEKVLGPDHPEVALTLNDLVVLYERQNRYIDTEPLLKRVLAIRERALGPDHPDVAQTLNNLAVVYGTEGRYAEAEPLHQRALKMREKALPADDPEVARSLDNLAYLYARLGRHAEAEPLFDRARAIWEKRLGPDDPEVASSLNHLAGLYLDQGRYAQAELLFERALAIRTKARGPDHPEVAVSLNDLGLLKDRQGRYAEAEQLYRRALLIGEQALGPDDPANSVTLANLAELYEGEGRYDEAELLHKRALTITERAFGPDSLHVAADLNNLAALYELQGRYPEAESRFKQALAIREKALPPDHPSVAQSMNNLAFIYDSEGRYGEAEQLYQRALAIRERALGPDHPDVAQTLNNLAELDRKQGSNYGEAERLFKRALAIQEQAFGARHREVTVSLNNLMLLYNAQGRYADALPLVRRMMSDQTAITASALPTLFGAQMSGLIAKNEAVEDGLDVVQGALRTSASEALNALAVRFSAGNDRLAQLVRQDQDLAGEAASLDKALIAAVSAEPSARDAASEQRIRERIAAIGKQRDELQAVFAREFRDYSALSNPQSLSLDDIEALLADDEVLVVIYLGPKSFVWAVTRGAADWQELAVSADEVSKIVSRLRTALNLDCREPFDPQLSFELYRQLLGPVEGIVGAKPRLSLVVNGALTSLPPHVLVTRDPAGKALKDADWLIRDQAVTVLPSVASLRVLRGKSAIADAQSPLIGFADPLFDQNNVRLAAANVAVARGARGAIADIEQLKSALPPLPETANELKRVAVSVNADPADLFLGPAATVTQVKQAKLDQFRIVYFATHGLLAGDVAEFAKLRAEPALVLSLPDKPTEIDDGLLKASEIAQLKLNADWVVLSACNTAAGDKPGAEALSGLARAFFYAGARSVLVSHWEVETNSAVALMTGTFAGLTADPALSHGQALRQSMLAMINNTQHPEWAEPKFWAPFIVVGEPAKLGG